MLAALADASGAGRYLIREIADCLKEEGLLDRGSDFSNVDQMLDGLERSAARLASALNTPPLDVATLRQEWGRVRRDLSKIPPKNLPTLESLGSVWTGMKQEAREQNRTVFEVSSLMAMSAIAAELWAARPTARCATDVLASTSDAMACIAPVS